MHLINLSPLNNTVNIRKCKITLYTRVFSEGLKHSQVSLGMNAVLTFDDDLTLAWHTLGHEKPLCHVYKELG